MDAVQAQARRLGYAVSVMKSTPDRNVRIGCVHAGIHRNTHKLTSETRQRKRTTKKKGDCNWELYASTSKDSGYKSWVVKAVSPESSHGHAMASDVMYYHQHRKPTLEMANRMLSMTNNSITPLQIHKELANTSEEGIILSMSDIYNYRHAVFEKDKQGTFSRLLAFLSGGKLHIFQFIIHTFNTDSLILISTL